MGVLYAGMGVFVSGDFYCPGCVCLLGVVLYIYFALKGEVLSLECPRESTQREGQPGCTHRLRRFPAFLANPGARTTRDLAALDSLKQGAHLDPGLAAVLGECKWVSVVGSCGLF